MSSWTDDGGDPRPPILILAGTLALGVLVEDTWDRVPRKKVFVPNPDETFTFYCQAGKLPELVLLRRRKP